MKHMKMSARTNQGTWEMSLTQSKALLRHSEARSMDGLGAKVSKSRTQLLDVLSHTGWNTDLFSGFTGGHGTCRAGKMSPCWPGLGS